MASDFADKVQEHIDVEDREVYQSLLIHKDTSINNTASRFVLGSAEIKRVFKQYLKRWCLNKSLRIKDHDKFVVETNEMFELVLSRIQDEVENLYPTVKKVALEAAA